MAIKIKAIIMMSLIRIFLFLLLFTDLSFAQGLTAGILPPAVTQFFDNNGNPLSSGTVTTYVPGTTTLKTTWKDAAETLPNTNPIVLDGGGKAIIYGDGSYRQLVKDRNGNIIWDAVTAGMGIGTPTAIGDGNLVGTVLPWAGLVAPNQYVFAYGQELPRTYTLLFATVTQTVNAICTNSSNTLTGVSDTTQIPIGAPIEILCVTPGTTVVSKTNSTITLSNPSTISINAAAVIFPYGNGDGSSTFNVPDLRGTTVVGRNNMGGNVSTRLSSTYYLTSPDAIAARGGAESHAQTVAEMATHNHGGNTAGNVQFSTNATITNPYRIVDGSNVLTAGAGAVNNYQGSLGNSQTFSFVTPASTFSLGINAQGSGNASSIVQPSLTMNYVIKVTADINGSITNGVQFIGGMTGNIACGDGLNCSANTISVSALAAGVPSSRTVNTTTPLSGGGNLSVDRTIIVIGAPGEVLNGGTTDGVTPPAFTPAPVLGVNGGAIGTLTFNGNTSGKVVIRPPAATTNPGGWNFNFPLTEGTSGQVLTSQAGGGTAMTWTTLAAIATAADTLGYLNTNVTSLANLNTVGTITSGTWNAGSVTSSSFITSNGGQFSLAASGYINWGGTLGTGGYGIRDNGGTVEFKNSAGSWNPILAGTFGSGANTQLAIYSGTTAIAGSANFIATSGPPALLAIGQNASVGGSLALYGSTSGNTTLLPTAIAGTNTLTLPAINNDTLVGKATTDSFTNKTFDTGATGNVFKVAGGSAITSLSNPSGTKLITGTFSSADNTSCIAVNGSGDAVATGTPCGGGGGGGTVGPGVLTQVAFFVGSTTTVGGDTGLTYGSNTLNIGASASGGILKLFGSASGSNTIIAPAAAASNSFTLPTPFTPGADVITSSTNAVTLTHKTFDTAANTFSINSTAVTTLVPIAVGGTGAATAAANRFFVGPASGGSAAPSFRTMVFDDLASATTTAYRLLGTSSAGVPTVVPLGATTTAGNNNGGGLEYTATPALRASAITNAQTGSTYAIADSDRGKSVVFNRVCSTPTLPCPIAVSIARAGGPGGAATNDFVDGWFIDVINNGLGIITITPTTSTINGTTTLVLYKGQSARIFSNGTDYFAALGRRYKADITAAEFGAMGDTTTTDDHDALQACINYSATASITCVLTGIVGNTFKVTTSLSFPSGASINGANLSASQATILFNGTFPGATTLYPANYVTGYTNSVTMQNFTIDAQNVSTANQFILWLPSVNSSIFRNIKIIAAPDTFRKHYGVRLEQINSTFSCTCYNRFESIQVDNSIYGFYLGSNANSNFFGNIRYNADGPTGAVAGTFGFYNIGGNNVTVGGGSTFENVGTGVYAGAVSPSIFSFGLNLEGVRFEGDTIGLYTDTYSQKTGLYDPYFEAVTTKIIDAGNSLINDVYKYAALVTLSGSILTGGVSSVPANTALDTSSPVASGALTNCALGDEATATANGSGTQYLPTGLLLQAQSVNGGVYLRFANITAGASAISIYNNSDTTHLTVKITCSSRNP